MTSFTEFLREQGFDIERLQKQTHSYIMGQQVYKSMRKRMFKTDLKSRIEMRLTKIAYYVWGWCHRRICRRSNFVLGCRHRNPFSRAYIDLDRALKEWGIN